MAKRKVPTQMEPLPKEPTSDTIVHFKGEDFPILNRHRFFRNCGKARALSMSMTVPIPTEISIESDVSRDSVVEFLKACQNKLFSLSVDTAHDSLRVCDEFDAPILRRRVVEWISAHESDLLISTLVFELETGGDASFAESRIRENFDSLFDDDKLMKLPLNVLCWLVDNNSRSIFDFGMKCLDRFGSSASIVFGSLDASRLSLE
jgi:hypothetical protein